MLGGGEHDVGAVALAHDREQLLEPRAEQGDLARAGGVQVKRAEQVAEGDRVAQEINGNSDFLNNPVITAGSLNQDQFSQGGNNAAPQGQPYYKKLSWAPKLYQIGRQLPWIFGGLALAMASAGTWASVVG